MLLIKAKDIRFHKRRLKSNLSFLRLSLVDQFMRLMEGSITGVARLPRGLDLAIFHFVCCGLNIARKWEKIGCGLKGKLSPGWRGAAAVQVLAKGKEQALASQEKKMGGNCVEAMKGSSSRGRRRVKCAAASREKIKTGQGAAVWKVIGLGLGLGFGFFCVFPQYAKLPPLMCVFQRLVFIGKNIARFSNLVPQLLSFFCTSDFSYFFGFFLSTSN